MITHDVRVEVLHNGRMMRRACRSTATALFPVMMLSILEVRGATTSTSAEGQGRKPFLIAGREVAAGQRVDLDIPVPDGSGRPGDRRPGHGVSRRGRGAGAGVDGRRPRLRVPADSRCPAVAHAHRSRPVVWHSRPGPARARRGLRAARALREPLRPKEPQSRVSREAGRHPGRAHRVGDHDRGHPPV